MTKQKLRNYCASLLRADGIDVGLFMDKKRKDIYAAIFMPVSDPSIMHLAFATHANSKTPSVHIIQFKSLVKITT